MEASKGPVRRLVGSSRPEMLIHALAQGPAEATADLVAEGEARLRLERLSRAYGVEWRVRFLERGDDIPAGPDGTFAELVESLYGPDDRPQPVPTGDDSVFEGERIAVVTNIPTHYRIPLLDRVARRLDAAGGRLHVVFLAAGYPRRAWMRPGDPVFDHTVLRSVAIHLGPERHPFVPRDLGRTLRRLRPSLVVAGGFSPFVAGRLALDRRVRVAVWSGETAAAAPSSRVGWATRRLVTSRAVAGIAYGAGSAARLARIAPGLPVAIARNATPAPSRGERRRDGPSRLLTVADLSTRRKGVDILLRALAALRDVPWTFTVVGGGVRLAEAGDLARSLGIEDRVTFAGAVPSDEVHAAYRDADVFALASRKELFGLAVIEAMGAGLATVVSTHVGAAEDLCADGRNAVVVAPNEPETWTGALGVLLSDPDLRARLGHAGRRTIERRWTMDHSADAFVAGLRLAFLR